MQTQKLFGAVHSYNEKETIFWIVKKVNSMKPKSQNRRADSVKRTKKMQEPQLQSGIFQQQKIKTLHIKGTKGNKQLVRVICWN